MEWVWSCILPPPLSPPPSPPQLNEEDIEGAFGGSDSRSRGYYSSMYTSSANAYMLMYRRIDKDANKCECTVISLRSGVPSPHPCSVHWTEGPARACPAAD